MACAPIYESLLKMRTSGICTSLDRTSGGTPVRSSKWGLSGIVIRTVPLTIESRLVDQATIEKINFFPTGHSK